MKSAVDTPALINRLVRQLNTRKPDMSEDVYRQKAEAYTDPARFELERQHIFLRTPVFAGLSGELKQPGDFLTTEIAGASLLLVRDQDGTLRAFRNACRHRGVKLVQEAAGNTTRFICPYHAWSYNTSGALTGLAMQEAFPGINKDTSSLLPVQVQEKYGLIFVRIEGDEPVDIDAHLAGLAPEFAEFGWDKWDVAPRNKTTRDVSWKLLMDTFSEAYHFPFVHERTLGTIAIPNLHVVDHFGPHIRELFANNGLRELAAQPEESRRAADIGPDYAKVYLLFPNLIIQGVRDGGWQAISLWPGSEVGKCSAIEIAMVKPGMGQEEHEKIVHMQQFAWTDIIQGEDWPLAESAWHAMKAGSVKEVVYGRNEMPLQHLHRGYDLAVQNATVTA